MYSNLTRFPTMRVTPDHARKMMYQFAQEFEHVELSVQDYLQAVDRCADRNLVSGVIFDALHFEAAVKAGAERLYTANTKDFCGSSMIVRLSKLLRRISLLPTTPHKLLADNLSAC